MTKVLVSLGKFLYWTLLTHGVGRHQDTDTQTVLVLVTNGPLKWSLLPFFLLKWSKMTKVLVSLGTFLDRTLLTHVVDRYQDIATQAVLVLVTIK